MIPEIFSFQPFYFLVLSRCYAEGGFCDLGGKDRVLPLTPYLPIFPLVRKFFPDGNTAHPLFDPIVGVTLRLVERPRPFRRQLRVFDLLSPLVAYLCQPPLEGFGFRGGSGL